MNGQLAAHAQNVGHWRKFMVMIGKKRGQKRQIRQTKPSRGNFIFQDNKWKNFLK